MKMNTQGNKNNFQAVIFPSNNMLNLQMDYNMKLNFTTNNMIIMRMIVIDNSYK